MKKRVVSLLLCLIMALSLIPTAAFATEGENVEETPVVEAQAEPAAEAQSGGDVAVLKGGSGGGHNPGTNNNGKPQALGWKYAKITSRNNGGYTCSDASGPSGATITVTVGKGTAAKTLTMGQSYEVWDGVTNTTDTPVTVSVSEGYYISAIVFCCNDRSGYNCQTSRTDLAFKRGGSLTDSSVTMTLGELWATTPHKQGNNTSPYNSCYWLMIMVKACPDPVYVGYDVGTIEGVDFGNIAPVDKNNVVDGGSWLANYYTKSYTRTGNTNPQHTVLGISKAAEKKANENGYTFGGWLAYRYDEYMKSNNSFSGGNIDPVTAAAGDTINLNAHYKLVAQWKEGTPPPPTTGNLIITKNVEGDVTLPTTGKTFTFVISGGDLTKDITVPVTVDANTKTGTNSVKDKLTYGQTYTVTETDAGINGYDVETSYTGTNNGNNVTIDTANKTIGVTNRYTKNTGSLTITKEVKGLSEAEKATLLKNLQFTLAKGTNSSSDHLNDDWTLTFAGASAGNHKLSETKANVPGYNLTTTYKIGDEAITPDTNGKISVNVEAGKTTTVTVTNKYEKIMLDPEENYATLTIKKVDDNNNPLPGAKFALYSHGDEIETQTSGADGLCRFTEPLSGADANYTLKEVTAPEGYVALNTVWAVGVTGGSDLEPIEENGVIVGFRDSYYSNISGVTNVDDEYDELPLNRDDNAYVITNTRATGNLTIEKEVDGIDNVTQEFQFNVYTVNGTEKVLYNTYTATTRAAAEIKGLPTGQYFVTEVATSADISGYSRNTTYQLLEDLVSVYSTTDVNGIYVEVTEDGTATVSVFNTYTKNTAGLVITKTLNEALPVDMTFEFNVMKGTSESVSATITIKAGEISGTAIVKNLTVGKTYTVQEVEKSAQLDGYTVAIPEAQKVTISGVATKDTVTFENVYTKNSGTLTISKVLKGDLVATDFDKPFTFTIWMGTKEVKSVEVWPGNPVTLTLDPGKYTIVEDKADVEGYDLTTSFAPDYWVEVKAGEDTAVVATNTYTKTVTPAPVEHTFTIDITKNIELLKRTSRNPGKASFTFEAYMVDEQKNVTVLGDVTIETRGTKSASGKLTFTLTDEQLTYGATVYVREVKGNARGWTYDDTIYKLEIGRGGEILTGDTDLTFTNVYYRKASSNTPTDDKTVKSVKTGDMGIAMYAMTSLLSLGGAALVIKKRKDEK